MPENDLSKLIQEERAKLTTEEAANTDLRALIQETRENQTLIAKRFIPDIEMTISANAANKLNLGNFSSADRGVFMSKKILIPGNLSEQEQFDLIRKETKKLQHLCEAQLAGIVAEYMSQEGYDDSTWTNLHKKIFTKAIRAAKAVFGIIDPNQATT